MGQRRRVTVSARNATSGVLTNAAGMCGRRLAQYVVQLLGVGKIRSAPHNVRSVANVN